MVWILLNFFSSKTSNGYVECSFFNSVEKFLAEGLKFLTQCPKLIEKKEFNRKKFFPQNVVEDTLNAVSMSAPVKCQRKSENFHSLSKKEEIKVFRMKIFSPKCYWRHIGCNFDSPVENFLPEGENFCSMSEK